MLVSGRVCRLGRAVVASQGSLTPNEQYKAFQPSSNGRKVSGSTGAPGGNGNGGVGIQILPSPCRNHQKETKDVA